MRGLSLGSSAFVQWFRRLNAATREMFAGRECGVRLDNARARLYSANFRPGGKTHINAALLEKALSILAGGDDISDVRERLMEATKPDSIR